MGCVNDSIAKYPQAIGSNPLKSTEGLFRLPGCMLRIMSCQAFYSRGQTVSLHAAGGPISMPTKIGQSAPGRAATLAVTPDLSWQQRPVHVHGHHAADSDVAEQPNGQPETSTGTLDCTTPQGAIQHCSAAAARPSAYAFFAEERLIITEPLQYSSCLDGQHGSLASASGRRDASGPSDSQHSMPEADRRLAGLDSKRPTNELQESSEQSLSAALQQAAKAENAARAEHPGELQHASDTHENLQPDSAGPDVVPDTIQKQQDVTEVGCVLPGSSSKQEVHRALRGFVPDSLEDDSYHAQQLLGLDSMQPSVLGALQESPQVPAWLRPDRAVSLPDHYFEGQDILADADMRDAEQDSRGAEDVLGTPSQSRSGLGFFAPLSPALCQAQSACASPRGRTRAAEKVYRSASKRRRESMDVQLQDVVPETEDPDLQSADASCTVLGLTTSPKLDAVMQHQSRNPCRPGPALAESSDAVLSPSRQESMRAQHRASLSPSILEQLGREQRAEEQALDTLLTPRRLLQSAGAAPGSASRVMQALREEAVRNATALEQVLTPRKLQKQAAAAPCSAGRAVQALREEAAEGLPALQQLRAHARAQSPAAVSGSASQAMRQPGSDGDIDTGVLECFLPLNEQQQPCSIVWQAKPLYTSCQEQSLDLMEALAGNSACRAERPILHQIIKIRQ